MSEKETPKDVISAYRKRQERAQRMPVILLIVFGLIVIVGAAALIFWLTDAELPQIAWPGQATETPTATATITPSPIPPTVTPTLTATQPPPTETPTQTLTPTRSGAVIYIAEEGDNFTTIAEKFDVDLFLLISVNQERLNLDLANPVVRVGDEVLIPAPGTQLPTPTPLPEGLPSGTRIDYRVQSGDTLAGIALKFNSTVEDILKQNEELEDANSIFVGQSLVIRVNLVTPVPTEETEPEETPIGTPGAIFTLTPEPTP